MLLLLLLLACQHVTWHQVPRADSAEEIAQVHHARPSRAIEAREERSDVLLIVVITGPC